MARRGELNEANYLHAVSMMDSEETELEYQPKMTLHDKLQMQKERIAELKQITD